MKSILFFSVVFLMSALPVLGELTPQDLDKIRLIVKEEVSESEARLRTEITESETRLGTEIAKSETRMKTYVDVKFESVNERLTLVVGFVSALIILVVVTVGIPQIIIAWRGSNERAQDRRIEELAREIETLKQKRIVNP